MIIDTTKKLHRTTTHEIQPFSEEQYAIVVLQGFRRLVRRTDYYMSFIHAKSVMQDNPDPNDVLSALDHAIGVLREKLVADEEHGGRG